MKRKIEKLEEFRNKKLRKKYEKLKTIFENENNEENSVNTAGETRGSSDSEDAPEPIEKVDYVQLLGEDPGVKVEPGITLSEAIVARWKIFLREGIQKENREQLAAKWPLAQNCPQLQGPSLNTEIVALLSVQQAKKDEILRTFQDKIGRGLTALGAVMDTVFSKEVSESLREILIPQLSDSAKFFAETHFLLSGHRRHQILPELKNSTTQKVAEESKPDNFLFGEGFGTKWKTYKEVEAATQAYGEKRQKIYPRENHLNSQRPRPPTARMKPTGQGERRPNFRFANNPPSYRHRDQGRRPGLSRTFQNPRTYQNQNSRDAKRRRY